MKTKLSLVVLVMALAAVSQGAVLFQDNFGSTGTFDTAKWNGNAEVDTWGGADGGIMLVRRGEWAETKQSFNVVAAGSITFQYDIRWLAPDESTLTYLTDPTGSSAKLIRMRFWNYPNEGVDVALNKGDVGYGYMMWTCHTTPPAEQSDALHITVKMTLDATNITLQLIGCAAFPGNPILFNGPHGFSTADLSGIKLVFLDDGGYRSGTYYDNVLVTSIPEPATMTILGLGLLGLLRKRS